MAPREEAATVGARVAGPLGLVNDLGLPPFRAPTRRPWIRLRPTTMTEMGGRPLVLEGTRPGDWTPVRRWRTPLWVGSPRQLLALLVTNRLGALVKLLVGVLLAGSVPGLRTNCCLLPTPPMA